MDTSSEGNCSVGSVIITLVGSFIITFVGSVIITLIGSVIITLIGSVIIPLSELGQNKTKNKAVPSHITELTTPLMQRKNAQYVLLHLKYGLGLVDQIHTGRRLGLPGMSIIWNHLECQLYKIARNVSLLLTKLPGMSII